ncbi:hypothetical protein, partial [Bacillus sp. AY2-1]|uniref:hypothetical protein n=1 Tax=Bacillus sp. AY2-1 TaxID=2217828 RepID=UPI001C550E58
PCIYNKRRDVLTSLLVTATVRVVVIHIFFYKTHPFASDGDEEWGFCYLFLKTYAEASRTMAFTNSFRNSNKKSIGILPPFLPNGKKG